MSDEKRSSVFVSVRRGASRLNSAELNRENSAARDFEHLPQQTTESNLGKPFKIQSAGISDANVS